MRGKGKRRHHRRLNGTHGGAILAPSIVSGEVQIPASQEERGKGKMQTDGPRHAAAEAIEAAESSCLVGKTGCVG